MHSEDATGGRVVRGNRTHDSLRSLYPDGRVLRPKVRATPNPYPRIRRQ
jgi:hypothetical protein